MGCLQWIFTKRIKMSFCLRFQIWTVSFNQTTWKLFFFSRCFYLFYMFWHLTFAFFRVSPDGLWHVFFFSWCSNEAWHSEEGRNQVPKNIFTRSDWKKKNSSNLYTVSTHKWHNPTETTHLQRGEEQESQKKKPTTDVYIHSNCPIVIILPFKNVMYTCDDFNQTHHLVLLPQAYIPYNLAFTIG